MPPRCPPAKLSLQTRLKAVMQRQHLPAHYSRQSKAWKLTRRAAEIRGRRAIANMAPVAKLRRQAEARRHRLAGPTPASLPTRPLPLTTMESLRAELLRTLRAERDRRLKEVIDLTSEPSDRPQEAQGAETGATTMTRTTTTGATTRQASPKSSGSARTPTTTPTGRTKRFVAGSNRLW